MAKDARIELRVPVEEKAAWVDAAGKADIGLSEWLRRAAKYAIRDEAKLRDNLAAATPFNDRALEAGRAAFDLPSFRCPTAGCEKTFGSERAVCPSHGRRAVPV